MEIPKKYDPKIEEPEIRKLWESQNVFTFDEHTDKPIFSIDTPPPTMSGKMHIGHACSYSQQDFIARYKRMKGFEVFYPFGTDDNGLPTEKLVQKEKKVIASKMDRSEFIKLCEDYVNEHRETFIQNWKNIGMSCDFGIFYSTIDDHSRKIAQKTFLDLVKEKRAYRKEAPVIWDTFFQSAIAQAELEDVEKETFFNDIVFKTEEGKELVIATTRPELLGACVAIFAHPDDKRYQHLFGKHALSPLYNDKVPILPDEKADPEKGTGIVMCCTFGDQTDIEWYKKHQLPLRMVITKDGRMNEDSGKYSGLKIEEARVQIIEDLKEAKLLVKQEKITHSVNVGERSGKPVEIVNTKQWYIKYTDKDTDFLKGSEELNWHPPFMKHRLDNWIKGLGWDWAIARQRPYGVPIPVWYDKDGKEYFADETQLPVDPLKDRPLSAPENIELTPEADVFDTWFTSSSSPFLAIEHFKDKPVYKKLFPMDMRPQGHDIVSTWLFYTMAKTRLLHGVNPWKKAIISGWVLDPQGKKMAKSKGNVVEPNIVIDKFSADILRYWASGQKLGDDLPYKEQELQNGKKLVTKIWNAVKFGSMHLENYDGSKPDTLEPLDQWMLDKTNELIKSTITSFDNYEYSKVRYEVDQFFWNTLCDNYLEIVKDRLYKPEIYGEKARQSGQYVVHFVLDTVLKLYAPFLPFITEKLYQLFFKKEVSIHRDSWPQAFEVEKNEGQIAVDFIASVRRFKAEKGVSLGKEISQLTITTDEKTQTILESMIADIKGTTKSNEVVFKKGEKTTFEVEFSD